MRLSAQLAIAGAVVLSACSAEDRPEAPKPAAIERRELAPSASAKATLSALRESARMKVLVERLYAAADDRFEIRPVLRASDVERFELDEANPGRVRPVLSATARRSVMRAARVELPTVASGPIRVVDEQSNAAISFGLRGARAAEVEVGDGLALYRAASPEGTDIVQRVTAEGVEDYIFFERRPSEEVLRYDVDVSGVDGLRLASNILVFVRNGVPTLRVSPPYIVGADHARHEPSLTVEGCAFDAGGPHGKELIAVDPGASWCTIRVAWAPDQRFGCARKDGSDDCAPVTYPAVLDPYWSTTSNIASPRWYMGTAVLSTINGDDMYVTGGNNGMGAVATVESLGDGASTWVPENPMSVAREGHIAIGYGMGNILVAGGITLNSAERYVGGTWGATANTMSVQRRDARAAMLPSGKIIITGGLGAQWNATTEIYTPATNNFAAGPTMNTARVGHSATVFGNGKILVAGGYDGAAAVLSGQTLTEGGAWVNVGNQLPVGMFRHSAALVGTQGKVLIVGGASSSAANRTIFANASLYDPVANTFAAVASMPGPRELFALLSVGGRGIVAGGRASDTNYLDTALVFDGVNTWAAIDPMKAGMPLANVKRALMGYSPVPGHRPLVIGGLTATGMGTATVNEFALLANGTACVGSTAFLCAFGNCVDGVCCDTACTGNCDRCNNAGFIGSCRPAALGSPGSPGSCGSYLCNGTLTSCPTTCSADTQCVSTSYCTANSNGTCAAKKATGATCAADTVDADGSHQCTSGFCKDGRCCESACTGACTSCANGTGDCVSVTSTDDNPECTGNNTCSAGGACLKDLGQNCALGPECASGNCKDGKCCNTGCGAGCQTCTTGTCSSVTSADDNPECTGINTCSLGGACLLENGQVCSVGSQCASGNCKDGKCCNTGCAGACQTCTTGTCSNVVSADDSPECTGNDTCTAASLCRKKTGQSCATGPDCATGNCVDGYCCNTSCNGACDRCNITPGTCATAPEGTTPSSACTGDYVCAGQPACPVSCGKDLHCEPGYFCAGNNTCQPRHAIGATCSDSAGVSAATCLQGGCRVCTAPGGFDPLTSFCRDGRCCQADCNGQCDSCANATGACNLIGAGLDGVPACSGGEKCDGAQASCPGGCTQDSGCATGYYCTSSSSGQCFDKADNGDPCSGDSIDPTGNHQCSGGHCVDGVCCDTACAGACDTCSVSPGTCIKRTLGSQGSPTCSPLTCDGIGAGCPGECSVDQHCITGRYCDDGACVPLLTPGQTCSTPNQCGTSICIDSVCCEATCDGACNRCDNTGMCVLVDGNPGGPSCAGGYLCQGLDTSCPTSCGDDQDCEMGRRCETGSCQDKGNFGAQCDAASDCISNFCVEGVCCDSSCNSICVSCRGEFNGNLDGFCGNVGAGIDPRDSCTAADVSTCDRDGECDGSGACQNYAAGTTCEPMSCSSNAPVTQQCDGSGACASEVGPSCGQDACIDGVCATTCASDLDCAGVAYCDAGTSKCTAKVVDASPCSEGRTCLSGFCADGVCCNRACSGQCEACDAPGEEGNCVPISGKPRASRPPCAAATGDNLCEEKACDGAVRATCEGFVSTQIVCQAQLCSNGISTLIAHCDGAGTCEEAVEVRCDPFVCGGNECLSECASDSDCAPKFRCDTALADCVAQEAGVCDPDGQTLRPVTGEPIDCAPFICEAGRCKEACTVSTDCVTGNVCDPATSRCVSSTQQGSEDGGCGCRAVGSPGRATHPGFGLGLLLLFGLRRRRFRETSRMS